MGIRRKKRGPGTTWRGIAGLGGVVLVTLAVYWQVHRHEFVTYDDPKYVTENKQVQAGISWEGVKWAFTAKDASNWHPVTWLSHMLDCELFGLNAGRHHIVNLLFHIANTLLLFFVFYRMTGGYWQCVFVAGLFALHPLHVESAAWAAERKDVLSTFFWLLTILAYVRYAERTSIPRYVLVVVFFVLGLMAKPMLVTLPLVLLLLDYWPLERIGGDKKFRKAAFVGLVIEKIPLLVLAGASSVVTLFAQQKMVVSLRGLGIYTRAANAFVSYLVYIWKMIWPMQLGVFYPHSKTVAVWQGAGAGLVLAAVTAAAIWYGRRYRYLLAGWLWYIVTLIPVIGIVQVGIQRYADRYTYVPLTGLFIIIAWGMPELLGQWRYKRIVLSFSGAIVLSVLAVCTWFQVGYWRNSVSLYEHAIAVTEGNYLAHNNLGVVLKGQGRIDEAIEHWQEALRIFPRYRDAIINLGGALADKGRYDEAIRYYKDFLKRNEGDCRLYNNLANAFTAKGEVDEAIKCYRKALEFDKNAWEVHYNLGTALIEKGRTAEAIVHFKEAVRIYPQFSQGQASLKQALSSQK